VLNIAGEKSKLFQKHGMDKVTDDLLDKEMTVNVNVGMGATDPVTRLQKFLVGVTSFTKISMKPPAGVNLEEVWKEIMALSGYQDGERFTLGANPEMARLQQTNTQLMQALQQMKMRMHDKSEANQVKREVARENNIVKLVTAHKEDMHQNVQMYANHLLSQEAQQQAAQMAAQQPQQPQQPQPGPR
jgi:predicted unusual protein kinase regulating ubiquinone biosynthesis (AarF/ABC1/UbiB family)